MTTSTKFTLLYVALAVVSCVAVVLGYVAHDLKRQVHVAKKAVATAILVQIQSDVTSGLNAYYTQKKTDAQVTSTTCEGGDKPTQYKCTLNMIKPSTGQTGSQKIVLTWTKAKGITDIKQG